MGDLRAPRRVSDRRSRGHTTERAAGLPRKLKTHSQRLREQHPRPSRRPSSSAMGYDGRWRKLRVWFLKRHPLCVCCKSKGRVEPATEVDHIVPLRWGGARLDVGNLQALCKRCHSRKSAREQGGGRVASLQPSSLESVAPRAPIFPGF